MSKEIVLISDYFYGDFTGGAELNIFSLLHRFKQLGIPIRSKKCTNVTKEDLRDRRVIVSNFVTLRHELKEYIKDNLEYVIYEHDHKYLKTRNPIFYPDFQAPTSDLANFDFYRKALSTVCLTKLALEVFRKNTKLENAIKIGSSVWRDEDLDYLLKLSKNNKNEKFAVLDSTNPIKKRDECIKYCIKRGLDFDLISDNDNQRFLKKLSKYKGIVFMTGHLETCCRLLVEAKMMNCEIITQKKLIGAASEDWFDLSGAELVEKIRDISSAAPQIFMNIFEEK